MSHVLVLKPHTIAEYAGTVAAPTTPNGALTPDLLVNGALGIYGIQNGAVIASNQDKLVLITDSTTTSGTGSVKASEFLGRSVRLYQGVLDAAGNNFPIYSPDITIKNIRRVTGQKYVASTFQVSYIGYNDVTATGSLNLPTLPVGYSEAAVKATRYPTQPQPPSPLDYDANTTTYQAYSVGNILSTYTAYQVVSALAAKINLGINPVATQNILQFNAEVVSDAGTRTALAANATVVNGSSLVTVTAHGLTVGTTVKLLGVVYTITAVTTNTFTLDRPYSGVSTTIAASNTSTGSYTGLTTYGLRLTNVTLDTYEFSVQDILSNATISIQIGTTYGFGTYALVANAEFYERPYRGDFATADATMKQVATYAVPGSTYNTYVIDALIVANNNDGNGADTTTALQIYVAFDASDANTTGYNQAAFENIMTTLSPTGTLTTGY